MSFDHFGIAFNKLIRKRAPTSLRERCEYLRDYDAVGSKASRFEYVVRLLAKERDAV